MSLGLGDARWNRQETGAERLKLQSRLSAGWPPTSHPPALRSPDPEPCARPPPAPSGRDYSPTSRRALSALRAPSDIAPPRAKTPANAQIPPTSLAPKIAAPSWRRLPRGRPQCLRGSGLAGNTSAADLHS